MEATFKEGTMGTASSLSIKRECTSERGTGHKDDWFQSLCGRETCSYDPAYEHYTEITFRPVLKYKVTNCLSLT